MLAALAGAAGFQFTFEWRPSVEECDDAARREAAKVKLAVEVKTEGIRYLGYELGGGLRGHVLKQIGIAHGTVGELVRSVHARTLLSVERALWTWTVYARFHAEKWCEVWPAVDKRDNAALERAQRRALVAILGHAAPPRARIKYDLLLAVFGLWRLDERRWHHRLRYGASLEAASADPYR